MSENLHKISENIDEENKPSFISKITVNKILHLKNFEIEIDSSELKHLLITGQNSCGKTVLMNRLRGYLQKLIDCEADVAIMHNYEKGLDKENPDLLTFQPNATALYYKYRSGYFVIAHFEARRNLKLSGMKTVKNIELPAFSNIVTKKGKTVYTKKNFLKYAVNQYLQRDSAAEQKDEKREKELNRWIDNFEKTLKTVDPRIEKVVLETKPDYHLSLIPKPPFQKFTFEQLADGFKSIYCIVAELILRMQNKALTTYDVEGLVLIDEPEAHLHLDTQKQILPILTKIFPRVQFIVATHSPFILSSLSNAVVYDLEKKEKIEDLTKYSVENIIETYFETNKYSIYLLKELKKYEQLASKKDLSQSEKTEFGKLLEYFTDSYESFSPEIQVKLQQIKLSQLGR